VGVAVPPPPYPDMRRGELDAPELDEMTRACHVDMYQDRTRCSCYADKKASDAKNDECRPVDDELRGKKIALKMHRNQRSTNAYVTNRPQQLRRPWEPVAQ